MGNARIARPIRWAFYLLLLAAIGIIGAGVLIVFAFVSLGFSNVAGQGTAARRAATRASASLFADVFRVYDLDTGAMPSSLNVLVPKYFARVPLDAWGHAFVYARQSDGSFTLTSLGADGLAGGRGENADLVWRFSKPPPGTGGGWIMTEESDAAK